VDEEFIITALRDQPAITDGSAVSADESHYMPSATGLSLSTTPGAAWIRVT